MKTDQFEEMVKNHGEPFIWGVLEGWERHCRIRHTHSMTLEERWEHFIRATDMPAVAAA